MNTPVTYTTQLQAGLGLIDETKVLLDIWQPGQNASQLYQVALDSGRFPNVTARRLRNVVAECFAPRYLANQGIAAQHLRSLSTRLNSGDLLQLFLLFTARANPILADFIREVYWDRYASGHTQVSNEDAKVFVQRGIDDGKTSRRWSETTVRRVSAYLTGCCADYGLLEKGTRSTRRMLTFRLGALLQAERELPNLIREVFGEHGRLFKLVDSDQWQKAEERLRTALTEFAQAAQASYQGRLFAHDALQGLQLIDLSRELFDVVVMNPPFGALSLGVKEYLAESYPDSKNDLLGVFVDRGLSLLRRGGRLGAITSRTCFFLTSFTDWRKKVVLGRSGVEVIADLGQGVMDDAMVEAAAYVLEKGSANAKAKVIRAIADDDRQEALAACVAAHRNGTYDARLCDSKQLHSFGEPLHGIPRAWTGIRSSRSLRIPLGISILSLLWREV